MMRIHKFFMLFNLLLAGLILWVGISIFRTWASARAREPLQDAGITKGDVTKWIRKERARSIKNFQSVIDLDIFQTRKTIGKPAPSGRPQDLVKVTGLNLELKGTMVGETGERLAVILDGKTREQEIYHANELVHGARIERIFTDHVILNRRGNRERLQMSYESAPPRTPGARPGIRSRRNTVRTVPKKQKSHEKRLPAN